LFFWFFHPPTKFETLTRRPQLRTRVLQSPIQIVPKHLKKAVEFALFFEGASHLRMKYLLISIFNSLSSTLKNQKVQQEFQISVLDKKRCYCFWFFHPAPKFETLARRTQLRKKEISARKEMLLRIKKNKIKKKVAKLSSGLSKKQVQALRVF